MLPRAPEVAEVGDRLILHGRRYLATAVGETQVMFQSMDGAGETLLLPPSLLQWARDLKSWYVPGRVVSGQMQAKHYRAMARHPLFLDRDDLAMKEMAVSNSEDA